MSKEWSQILVSKEVKERLKNCGKTGESFDTVLRRLLGLPQRERKIKAA